MTIEVPGGNPDADGFAYDEFAYFGENCAEYALEVPDAPTVERVGHTLASGRVVSALRWGAGEPRLVLLHGGAQNAHTWDTVLLALGGIDALAIDLPGHGHSGWRDDGAYGPHTNADDVAEVVAALAPDAEMLVGMSLGGLTATAVAARHPELVRRLLVVDITPGVNRDKAADVHAFIEGPQTFGSFREIFERTVEYNPTRSPESLRRGILHNAHRRDDGTWQWNYDRGLVGRDVPDDIGEVPDAVGDHTDLWADVEAVRVPMTLVRGSVSPVVDDDDVAELRRRRPGVEVLVVDGAGHSIQGDRPVELAGIISARLGRPS